METATVGVLKEVFEFGEAMVSNVASDAVIATHRDLDTGVDGVEELTMTADELLQEEIDPGSSR